MTAASGCPASAVNTNTSVSAATVRPRPAASRPRSIRKSVQGRSAIGVECGKKIQGGVKEKPSENATEAKAAARGEAPSSRVQSQTPAAASRIFIAPASTSAFASGQKTVASVSGENAAERLLAARGMPPPFQRFQSGRDPSFHAILTALVQGRIIVATSFKKELYGSGCPGSYHGRT